MLKGVLKSYSATVIAIFVAAISAGITLHYNAVLGAVELVIVAVLLVYGYLRIYRNFRRLSQQVSALNASMRLTADEQKQFESYPFAVALCDKLGNVVWYNHKYNQLIIEGCEFDQPDIMDCLDVADLFDLEILPSTVDADIKGTYFTVTPVRHDDELMALYFVEDTQLKCFRMAYLKTRPVAVMINIDSLEHTEDTYSHIDFSTIYAEINKIISSWLDENHCVFRRYSDERYFALTEYDNFSKMTARRFDLLDQVRNYRYDGQDSGITLSMGIGIEPTVRECENSARQALDMARGRGGDQVAIKTDEGFDFFGGIGSKKDKRGKIKSRTVAAALCEIIEKSDNVLLMGHSFSDFDAIGSCVGLASICASVGVKANIVVNYETTLALPLIELCEQNGMGGLFVNEEAGLSLITDDTLLIITDIMRPNNVESKEILDLVRNVVVVDHHRMTVDKIMNPVLLFHEPYASSSAEMVVELIQYAPSKPRLVPIQAEALMAGIILDTKNFSFRVGVRTFEAAAFLRDKKSDTVRVKKLFSLTEDEKAIVNTILLSAKIYDNYAVAFTDSQAADVRKLSSRAADDMLEIKGVEASFVVYPHGTGIAISARSLGTINVQLIMEKLGGGGHQSMAGAQLKDVTAQQAMDQLAQAIQYYFNSEV